MCLCCMHSVVNMHRDAQQNCTSMADRAAARATTLRCRRAGAAAGIDWSEGLQADGRMLPWLAALLCHALQLLLSSSALCMLLQALRRIPIRSAALLN